jgi:nucleotide-binding universal stress UspA family protein
MFDSIIVAVDGSDHAEKALTAASALAGLSKGALHIVTVPQQTVEPMLIGYQTVPVPISREDMLAKGEAVLASAVASLPDGVKAKATSAVLFGDPAHAIVDEATAKEADVIVLGRRGLGRLTGLLVGSTTTKVSQLAPCAVLTVK